MTACRYVPKETVKRNMNGMIFITVHTPAGLCPVTRFAMRTNRKKTRFGAAALGFSVTSAALHSQKTPRIGWCVNSKELSEPLRHFPS